ncbi:MAG: hypothetical protein HY534_06370 [Chloroflexi bacterium]|nr:hypothetical protein [Chloroflexota bacterium]
MLLGALRLAHALAAVLWVGSALVVALSSDRHSSASSPVLRETIGAGVAVFVLTGTILAVQRLASAPVPPSYPVVLAAKVGLAVWMFWLARKAGLGATEALSPRVSINWQLAMIGILIYALAIALRAIYEGALRP